MSDAVLQNVYDKMITDYRREASESMEPLYGEIIRTRVGQRLIVTCAPTVALISPEVLFHERAMVRVHASTIEIADQVEYLITGWDRNHQALIVLLERDMR